MDYNVVIPAAGQGKRMKAGKNKQFLKLNGIEVLAHTVAHFEKDSRCKDIVIVANEKELDALHNLKDQYGWKKVQHIISGGKERQDSVYEGLKQLHGDEIVFIHDGARPFITQEMIDRIVHKVSETGKGVIAAVPVKDTIKKATHNEVTETLDRTSLWAVQTPQAFPLSLIKEAHAQASEQGMIGTDDASLVEAMGHKVHLVQGDYHNIKLTTPEDLIFARAIIEDRNEEK